MFVRVSVSNEKMWVRVKMEVAKRLFLIVFSFFFCIAFRTHFSLCFPAWIILFLTDQVLCVLLEFAIAPFLSAVCPLDKHWTTGTDALVFFILFIFFLPLLLSSLVFLSLQSLMGRLRVPSMQADMPVGSGGSTCSPFHNVHSFHNPVLHDKDT